MSEEKEHQDLIKQLHKNTEELHRFNSGWHSFKVAIIRGIGTAIGVTLFGGIIIAILDLFITSAYDIPILNKVLHLFPQSIN